MIWPESGRNIFKSVRVCVCVGGGSNYGPCTTLLACNVNKLQ